MKKPLVSCVMRTYRRFNCVHRSIACFLAQKTELDTELIIFNTDNLFPLELDFSFTEEERNKIKIINNHIDYETGSEYNNTGSLTRDAFSHVRGDYFITWDDDDFFFPWNIQQCYDGLQRTGLKAWKPYRSFAWMNGQDTRPDFVSDNYVEASVMLHTDAVFFDLNTVNEHLAWYHKLDAEGQMSIDRNSIPAYCFNWKDSREHGGHKQSGHLGHPDNFNMHKRDCIDVAKKPITKKSLKDYKDRFQQFDYLLEECKTTHKDLIEKYVEINYYNE